MVEGEGDGAGDEEDGGVFTVEGVEAVGESGVEVGGVTGVENVFIVGDGDLEFAGGDVEPFFAVVLIGFVALARGGDGDGEGLEVEGFGGTGEGGVGEAVGGGGRSGSTADDDAVGGVVGLFEEGGDGDAKGGGDGEESGDGGLAVAGLDAGEVGFGEAGAFGEFFEGPAAGFAHGVEAVAEGEDDVVGMVVNRWHGGEDNVALPVWQQKCFEIAIWANMNLA